MPKYTDSLDKIVTVYFAALTIAPFEYKGVVYAPRPLRVSPGLFRGYTCPPNCAGCCPRFSLDYLPIEAPVFTNPRSVVFNGRKNVIICSQLQEDHRDYHCRFVDKRDGRCLVHAQRPLSCDFELCRFSFFAEKGKPTQFTTRMYGRGWRFRRSDGQLGALCEITPADINSWADTRRKLVRMGNWMVYFGLDALRVHTILTWSSLGIPSYPLFLK